MNAIKSILNLIVTIVEALNHLANGGKILAEGAELTAKDHKALASLKRTDIFDDEVAKINAKRTKRGLDAMNISSQHVSVVEDLQEATETK